MKRIKFYSSFAEQKIEEANDSLKISDAERFKQTVDLIKRVYADELNNYIHSNRINFQNK